MQLAQEQERQQDSHFASTLRFLDAFTQAQTLLLFSPLTRLGAAAHTCVTGLTSSGLTNTLLQGFPWLATGGPSCLGVQAKQRSVTGG